MRQLVSAFDKINRIVEEEITFAVFGYKKVQVIDNYCNQYFTQVVLLMAIKCKSIA